MNTGQAFEIIAEAIEGQEPVGGDVKVPLVAVKRIMDNQYWVDGDLGDRPELQTMDFCDRVISVLPRDQRQRVVAWLFAKSTEEDGPIHD